MFLLKRTIGDRFRGYTLTLTAPSKSHKVATRFLRVTVNWCAEGREHDLVDMKVSQNRCDRMVSKRFFGIILNRKN